MAQDIKRPSEIRDALVHRVIAGISGSHNASDMYHEAYSALLGVNRTDGRCLDIVQRSGPLTAGRLADLAGLTTGAATFAIDRLEKAGYVHRRRDTADRRRVFVEMTDLAKRLGELVHRERDAVSGPMMEGLAEGELATIARFLESREIINRRLAVLLQMHVPTPGAGTGERVQHARDYARDARPVAHELLAGVTSLGAAVPARPQRSLKHGR